MGISTENPASKLFVIDDTPRIFFSLDDEKESVTVINVKLSNPYVLENETVFFMDNNQVKEYADIKKYLDSFAAKIASKTEIEDIENFIDFHYNHAEDGKQFVLYLERDIIKKIKLYEKEAECIPIIQNWIKTRYAKNINFDFHEIQKEGNLIEDKFKRIEFYNNKLADHIRRYPFFDPDILGIFKGAIKNEIKLTQNLIDIDKKRIQTPESEPEPIVAQGLGQKLMILNEFRIVDYLENTFNLKKNQIWGLLEPLLQEKRNSIERGYREIKNAEKQPQMTFKNDPYKVDNNSNWLMNLFNNLKIEKPK